MNPIWLLRFICDHPINRRRPLGAIFDFCRWQMVSRTSGKPVLYSWISGSKVLVRRDETGFTMNIYCGLADLPEMGYLLHVLRADDLFVDIGANVGAYTLLAALGPRARVVCFEPAPKTYARLATNLELNNLDDRVRALNHGLGDKAGLLRFSVDWNCQNRVLTAEEDSPAVEIEVHTLDGSLGDELPALLKIDVEGFELAVLRGATRVLENPALHSVILEVNNDIPQYGHRRQDVLQTMEVAGFSPFFYDPFTRILTPLPDRNEATGNAIYVRDQALASLRERLQSAPRFRVKNVEL